MLVLQCNLEVWTHTPGLRTVAGKVLCRQLLFGSCQGRICIFLLHPLRLLSASQLMYVVQLVVCRGSRGMRHLSQMSPRLSLVHF